MPGLCMDNSMCTGTYRLSVYMSICNSIEAHKNKIRKKYRLTKRSNPGETEYIFRPLSSIRFAIFESELGVWFV